MASDRSRQRYWREESPEPSDSDEATIPDPEQFQTADPDHRSLAHQFESDLIELEGEDRLLMTVWEDDWVVLLWVHTVEAGTQDFDDDEDEASNDNESAADVQQYPSEPSESLQQRGTADPSWLSVSSGLSTIVEASELSELGQESDRFVEDSDASDSASISDDDDDSILALNTRSFPCCRFL